jgi:hypothetical protein
LADAQNGLIKSEFIFLSGLTGVGKTTFMEKTWPSDKRRRYVGVENIQQWADDRSPCRKVLFIDEANITRNNWSQFEGLLHPRPGVVIGRQYVELTGEHKVVFAGNPASYSDDRSVPSLLKRHGNACPFVPIPAASIYQKILLPIFGEDSTLAESICKPILELNDYFNKISTSKILITPRELIMAAQLTRCYCSSHQAPSPDEAAKYYAYHLSRQFVPKEHQVEFEAMFNHRISLETPVLLPPESKLTLTESNIPSANLLTDFIQLRQFNIDNHSVIPPGLGGITIESLPGLGKSELAIGCLRGQGFMKRSLDAVNEPPIDRRYFYHLPGGASLKAKKEILIKAFNEGAVVLCDEINTSASMESLLNNLLMGKGPNGEAPRKSGFLLIGTQNPSTMPGRINASMAMQHRMHYRVLPHYSVPEMKTILERLGLPDRRKAALISQYTEKARLDRRLCFRNVIHRAEEILTGLLGRDYSRLTSAELLAKASDRNSNSEVLDALFRHKQCNTDVLRALIIHPNVNRELLRSLVEKGFNLNGDDADYMMNQAISHPQCDELILTRILERKPIPLVLMELLKHPRLTPQHMKDLVRLIPENNPEFLKQIISHKHCSYDILEAIIDKTNDPKILMAVIWTPQCKSSTLLKIVSKSTDKTLLRCVLMQPCCYRDVLLKIMNPPNSCSDDTFDWCIKMGNDKLLKIVIENSTTLASRLVTIAENTSNQELIKRIMKHPNYNDTVLNAIINNPATSTPILKIIIGATTLPGHLRKLIDHPLADFSIQQVGKSAINFHENILSAMDAAILAKKAAYAREKIDEKYVKLAEFKQAYQLTGSKNALLDFIKESARPRPNFFWVAKPAETRSFNAFYKALSATSQDTLCRRIFNDTRQGLNLKNNIKEDVCQLLIQSSGSGSVF